MCQNNVLRRKKANLLTQWKKKEYEHITLWSSSLVQGPFINSGFKTFCHRCWHWKSERFWKNLDDFVIGQLSSREQISPNLCLTTLKTKSSWIMYSTAFFNYVIFILHACVPILFLIKIVAGLRLQIKPIHTWN